VKDDVQKLMGEIKNVGAVANDAVKEAAAAAKAVASATAAVAAAAAAAAAAPVASAPTAAKSKASIDRSNLNEIDKKVIESWIQIKVRSAIEEYKKNNAKAGAVATKKSEATAAAAQVSSKSELTQDVVMEWINNAVETFAADRTGKVDYAIHSSGARIVGKGNAQMTSPTYINPNSTISSRAARAFGLSAHHRPEELIKPTNSIGR
jgi:hypothetical protein